MGHKYLNEIGSTLQYMERLLSYSQTTPNSAIGASDLDEGLLGV